MTMEEYTEAVAKAEPKEEPKPKTYRTLSEVMELPGRESMAIVARIAPAIERFASKSGVLKLMFSDTVVLASSPSRMAKLDDKARAKVQADMIDIGEKVVLAFLKYGLGECLPDMQEIVAAINGITVDELLDNYTTAEIISMVKVVLTDDNFLSSLATLTN